jgi:hypothetical protein
MTLTSGASELQGTGFLYFGVLQSFAMRAPLTSARK